MELDKSKLGDGNVVKRRHKKSKVFSEETRSNGEASSFKSSEGKDVDSSDQVEDSHHAQSEAQISETSIEHHIPSRPVARISAFTIYSHGDSTESAPPAPYFSHFQGPLNQASNRELGINKLLGGEYTEHVVPHQCGHGCCEVSGGANRSSLLLGPEFIDYTEPSLLASQELAALAADISNVAWCRSGLENGGIKSVDSTSCG